MTKTFPNRLTLPEAVTKAAAAIYTGYTIEAAYKGRANDYKLSLKMCIRDSPLVWSISGRIILSLWKTV